MDKLPVVYILASQRNGTLYVGVTSHIQARAWLHANDKAPGFTNRYQVHRLVYYEVCGSMMRAIEREKQLKHWRRDWKIQLIERNNPEWLDLSGTLGW
jgi:putative endonuclease